MAKKKQAIDKMHPYKLTDNYVFHCLYEGKLLKQVSVLTSVRDHVF